MHTHKARRPVALAAGVAALALALTACSGSDKPSGSSSDTGSGSGGEKITLTIQTFNEFGYADLYKQYMDEHPNIVIKENKAATSEEAKTNVTTKIAASSGLDDIVAADGDWMPELVQYPDKFVDMASDDVTGRWPDWKVAAATSADGKFIGYGTDSGPEAICYRQDLFEKAGLPTDRDQVAELLGGADATWDDYFNVGKQFMEKAPKGTAWFDSATATFQGMVNQIPNAYEESDGTPRASLDDDTEVKAMYDQLLTATVDGNLSAHLGQWDTPWTSAFQNGAFATMLCPAWMTTIIEGAAEGVDGWNIADVFPGGGGNWGGSYLLVPTQSKHQEEAKALADWLTAPEQAAKVFTSVGNFPSQVAAQKDPAVTSKTNPFFNDAPTGQIFSDRAAAVTVTPFKGPHYFVIHKTVQDALNKVDIDQSATPEEAWEGAKSDFASLGL